ncbi:hypothetical protein [Tenggerimyces flavus]|uniref:Uncharacterized protein n=1 Tax=Tenggerimyces flavus TaxID=1708749 RepID=A0ABV7YIX9_9ACTN|nr:hypothetical protein [Tenggerimyces flavus]MBM7784567.1 hypothetical protein [Tenggerimyces flavus]
MNVEYAQRVRRLARLRIRAEVARRRAERLQATRTTGKSSAANTAAEPALIRPRRARHADQTQRATS